MTRTTRIATIFTLLCLPLTVAACGGGGGSTQTPPTTAIATTPPVIGGNGATGTGGQPPGPNMPPSSNGQIFTSPLNLYITGTDNAHPNAQRIRLTVAPYTGGSFGIASNTCTSGGTTYVSVTPETTTQGTTSDTGQPSLTQTWILLPVTVTAAGPCSIVFSLPPGSSGAPQLLNVNVFP